MRRSAVAFMALLTFLFTAGSAPTFTAGATPTLTPGPRPWPTDHGDNRRSGFYPSGTLFRHLTKVWGRGLDGAVYGSPIAVGGFVFVATENNSVYKVSAATGAIRWRRHLSCTGSGIESCVSGQHLTERHYG